VRWDIATQIQQGVHLDSGLVPAELGPREQRKTQVNGRRIERIEIVLQFETDRVFGMKGARYPDQVLREVGEDAPVVRFASIGQRRPRHLAVKAQMIQLAFHRPQTSFDVSQAFAVSELGECHRQILIPTREAPAMAITIVAGYAFLEFLVRKIRDQFRKHEAASVHPPLCVWGADRSPGAVSPFSIQIVPDRNSRYPIPGKRLAAFRKVLYRTLVKNIIAYAKFETDAPMVIRIVGPHQDRARTWRKAVDTVL
jgi:hypothetical protein